MHQFDLRNRTAIITGGAQGLGLGIAKRFIESGAEVIIWDIDKRLIKEAKQELNSNKLTSQIVDVTDFEDIKTISDYWIAAQTKINLADKIIFLKTHSALCTVENNPFTNRFNT